MPDLTVRSESLKSGCPHYELVVSCGFSARTVCVYRGIHATQTRLLVFRIPFKLKKASQVDPLSSRLLSDRRINNPGSVAHSRWLQ